MTTVDPFDPCCYSRTMTTTHQLVAADVTVVVVVEAVGSELQAELYIAVKEMSLCLQTLTFNNNEHLELFSIRCIVKLTLCENATGDNLNGYHQIIMFLGVVHK